MRKVLMCGAFYSPPLVHQAAAGEFSGPLPNIVARMAERRGLLIEFQHLSHSALANFVKTDFDLALSVFNSPERLGFGKIEGVVAEVAIQAAGLSELSSLPGCLDLNSILQSRKRVVVKQGDIGHDIVSAHEGGSLDRVYVEPAASDRGLKELLNDPRIDFVISDALTLTSIITSSRNTKVPRRLMICHPSHWLELGVLISDSSPYSPEDFKVDWEDDLLRGERQRLLNSLKTYEPSVLRPTLKLL